jgi:PA14 domain
MPTPQGFQQGGLNAYYFKDIQPGTSWGNAAAQSVDATLNFDWGYGRAASGAVGNDNFGAVWRGKIQAIATGFTKFFSTTDDGVAVKVAGQNIINQWRDQAATEHQGGIYMQAGQFYDLEVAYYEKAGRAVMKLAWEAPGQTKQIISTQNLFYDAGIADTAGGRPNSNLTPIALTSAPVIETPIEFKSGEQRFGISTSVMNPDGSYTGSRTVKSIDFDFGQSAPTAGTKADNFSINVSGRLLVQNSGWYNFFTTADDSVRMSLNDQTLANNPQARSTTTYQNSIWLEAGQSHYLSATYQDLGGASTFKIEWSGADTKGQRQALTDRNMLTLSDRMPINVNASNMFEAYDRTAGGDMSKLKAMYPNPLFF